MNVQDFMDVINKNFNNEEVKAKLLIEFLKSEKAKTTKKASKLKGRGLIPMLNDRKIDVEELLWRTGANMAYLNRLNDGSTKMTKEFASQVDSIMCANTGTFYKAFMMENS